MSPYGRIVGIEPAEDLPGSVPGLENAPPPFPGTNGARDDLRASSSVSSPTLGIHVD